MMWQFTPIPLKRMITTPLSLGIYLITMRDFCINMSNHQNAIFLQLDNFIKHSHSFSVTIFHKITHSAKLVILLIISIYAKNLHENIAVDVDEDIYDIEMIRQS